MLPTQSLASTLRQGQIPACSACYGSRPGPGEPDGTFRPRPAPTPQGPGLHWGLQEQVRECRGLQQDTGGAPAPASQGGGTLRSLCPHELRARAVTWAGSGPGQSGRHSGGSIRPSLGSVQLLEAPTMKMQVEFFLFLFSFFYSTTL